MKRPVLYFDDFDKIHNNQFEIFQDLRTLDDIVKYKFGNFFKENEINDLENLIKNSILNFKEKDNEIDKFINDNFFNYNLNLKYIIYLIIYRTLNIIYSICSTVRVCKVTKL